MREGDDAVEPLLDCLENDTRGTRTIDRGWRQPAGTRVMGVEEPALEALLSILKLHEMFPPLNEPYVWNFVPQPALGRQELAKVIRAYWEKVRDKTPAERWYGVLADDNAPQGAWAEAAENIVHRESGLMSIITTRFPFPPEPARPGPMHCESLRGVTGPSVSELIARRLKDISAVAEKDPSDFHEARGNAGTLAKALVDWDGRNQIETLRWYCADLEKIAPDGENRRDRRPMDELIQMYLIRKRLGDNRAMADYARWIRQTDASALASLALKTGPFFLTPIWMYPNDPSIAGLRKWMFADPSSPWAPAQNAVNPAWLAEAANSPLVVVPEFRSMLLGRIRNGLVVGVAETAPPWRERFHFDYEGRRDFEDSEGFSGSGQEMTLGDKIAWKLSQVRGVPEFEPGWPKEKHDQAIADISAFVRQYGNRWTWLTKGYFNNDQFLIAAKLGFPLLNRPATGKDVAAGRAIFSLKDASERRVWTMPNRPMQAKWIAAGNDQDVEIWQVEEGVVNGKRERIFGVVAKNRLAAVPGDEIQFVPVFQNMCDGWETGGDLVRGPRDAVQVKVHLQNQWGAPRKLPLTLDDSKPVSAEDLGMKVTLEYSQDSPPQWKPLDPRGPLEVQKIAGTSKPGTFESTGLLQVDLAKAFDLTRPGAYQSRIVFAKGGAFQVDHEVYVPRFEVKE